MNNIKTIWHFLPDKYKKKALLIAFICTFTLAFFVSLGYYMGVKFGINHANQFWMERMRDCICLK
jgi:hypothetical protein